MNFEELKNMLPHRFPLMMLDKVTSLEVGRSLVALKNVTGNEIYFLGHFPEKAVMPGILIIEAIAQAAHVLFEQSNEPRERETIKVLASINIKFLKPVVPGDQLVMDLQVVKLIEGMFLAVEALCTVDDEPVAKGELMLLEKEIGALNAIA